jgi:hypothetical protein
MILTLFAVGWLHAFLESYSARVVIATPSETGNFKNGATYVNQRGSAKETNRRWLNWQQLRITENGPNKNAFGRVNQPMIVENKVITNLP